MEPFFAILQQYWTTPDADPEAAPLDDSAPPSSDLEAAPLDDSVPRSSDLEAEPIADSVPPNGDPETTPIADSVPPNPDSTVEKDPYSVSSRDSDVELCFGEMQVEGSSPQPPLGLSPKSPDPEPECVPRAERDQLARSNAAASLEAGPAAARPEPSLLERQDLDPLNRRKLVEARVAALRIVVDLLWWVQVLVLANTSKDSVKNIEPSPWRMGLAAKKWESENPRQARYLNL